MINKQAQSLIEYIIIIGVVMTAVYVMAPSFKRGTQRLIKVTADQLGPQQNAEQDFGTDTSHMESQSASSGVSNSRTVSETAAGVRTISRETTQSYTNTITDGGIR